MKCIMLWPGAHDMWVAYALLSYYLCVYVYALIIEVKWVYDVSQYMLSHRECHGVCWVSIIYSLSTSHCRVGYGGCTWMHQCQNEVWTRSVCQSLSIWTLLVTKVFTTSWFLNNFKTASPLPNRLHSPSVSNKAIKEDMTRARVGQGCQDEGSSTLVGASDSRRDEECVLSTQSLGTWGCGFHNDFIQNDCILEGDGQVASGSASLPDPVVLETEEQMLEREQNERDVLSDALDEYKCDSGMSIENVPALLTCITGLKK